jgi:hypothetical protein
LEFAVIAGGMLMASGPAASGDADAGRALARVWCTEYHLVEENQKQARDIEPPFTQIAGDSAKSSLSIAAWLADLHPPKPSLSQKQNGGLVAHCRGLKTEGASYCGVCPLLGPSDGNTAEIQ